MVARIKKRKTTKFRYSSLTYKIFHEIWIQATKPYKDLSMYMISEKKTFEYKTGLLRAQILQQCTGV